jgi:hypothetical protein
VHLARGYANEGIALIIDSLLDLLWPIYSW